MAMLAPIPLVSKTGRMFVHLSKWGVPVCMVGVWFGFGFRGAATGDWTLAGFWALVFSSNTLLLWFRTRLFLGGWFATIFAAVAIDPALACINYAELRVEHFKTYAECLEADYQTLAIILSLIGAFILFLIGRQLANNALAWRDARESKELHRGAWRKELSKVAASPEVMDGLWRRSQRISRELQEQRSLAVRSLGVVGKVTAFLNEHAGRWSLRGLRSKARQVHGDIDLLFDEATMVNEPFLDLMASLVASPNAADGKGWGVARARSGGWTVGGGSARPALALKRGPVKKPDRALQKLVRVYGRDVAMLTDLVRCTVLAEDLRQVEALMATLEARSVVGLAEVGRREEEGDEDDAMLRSDASDDARRSDASEDARILRITAIHNRFDGSYDDTTSAGYRDLSLSVEVGWVMREGRVSFERVRDWKALECQRHICEIQVRMRSQHQEIVTKGLHTRYVELRNQYNC